MENRPPRDPSYPESPDHLERGLRGPIGGVTRIGPRAFALGFFVICALLVAILWGLNRGGPLARSSTEAYVSPPPAPPTNDPHFGQNEPIVATAAPATDPPPLVLQPTAVPNLDQQQQAPQQAQPAAQPQGPSADQQAEMQRQDDERRRQAEDEKKRLELIEAAKRSPILTGTSNSGNSSGSGGPTQLAFAGNGGDQGPQAQFASLSSGLSGGGAGGAGAGTSGQFTGRSAPLPSETRAARTTAYLQGPSGQFVVQAANVVLPQGGNPKDFLQAQRFAPVSPFEIVASSVIPASLITAIDSELPGLISAEVREDVYDSKTGRYLLIPKGSRLIGLYDSQTQYGQSRVVAAWQRLIFPDTTSIDLLNMSGADQQGGSGLAGTVDNHYGKIIGAALLTSVLAGAAALVAPQQNNVFQNPSASQVISQSVGSQITSTGVQIIQKGLNIPPVIHIPRGYPFLVIVDRDIVLPGVYHPQ